MLGLALAKSLPLLLPDGQGALCAGTRCRGGLRGPSELVSSNRPAPVARKTLPSCEEILRLADEPGRVGGAAHVPRVGVSVFRDLGDLVRDDPRLAAPVAPDHEDFVTDRDARRPHEPEFLRLGLHGRGRGYGVGIPLCLLRGLPCRPRRAASRDLRITVDGPALLELVGLPCGPDVTHHGCRASNPHAQGTSCAVHEAVDPCGRSERTGDALIDLLTRDWDKTAIGVFRAARPGLGGRRLPRSCVDLAVVLLAVLAVSDPRGRPIQRDPVTLRFAPCQSPQVGRGDLRHRAGGDGHRRTGDVLAGVAEDVRQPGDRLCLRLRAEVLGDGEPLAARLDQIDRSGSAVRLEGLGEECPVCLRRGRRQRRRGPRVPLHGADQLLCRAVLLHVRGERVGVSDALAGPDVDGPRLEPESNSTLLRPGDLEVGLAELPALGAETSEEHLLRLGEVAGLGGLPCRAGGSGSLRLCGVPRLGPAVAPGVIKRLASLEVLDRLRGLGQHREERLVLCVVGGHAAAVGVLAVALRIGDEIRDVALVLQQRHPLRRAQRVLLGERERPRVTGGPLLQGIRARLLEDVVRAIAVEHGGSRLGHRPQLRPLAEVGAVLPGHDLLLDVDPGDDDLALRWRPLGHALARTRGELVGRAGRCREHERAQPRVGRDLRVVHVRRLAAPVVHRVEPVLRHPLAALPGGRSGRRTAAVEHPEALRDAHALPPRTEGRRPTLSRVRERRLGADVHGCRGLGRSTVGLSAGSGGPDLQAPQLEAVPLLPEDQPLLPLRLERFEHQVLLALPFAHRPHDRGGLLGRVRGHVDDDAIPDARSGGGRGRRARGVCRADLARILPDDVGQGEIPRRRIRRASALRRSARWLHARRGRSGPPRARRHRQQPGTPAPHVGAG